MGYLIVCTLLLVDRALNRLIIDTVHGSV